MRPLDVEPHAEQPVRRRLHVLNVLLIDLRDVLGEVGHLQEQGHAEHQAHAAIPLDRRQHLRASPDIQGFADRCHSSPLCLRYRNQVRHGEGMGVERLMTARTPGE